MQARDIDALLRKAPQPLRRQNDEVYYATSSDRRLSHSDIAWLKSVAEILPRNRARICLHRDLDDPVHEMIIALTDRCYVAPHAHPYKEESLHVVEGRARAVLFSESGDVEDVISVSSDGEGTASFANPVCRFPRNRIHALLIDSPWLVFHEVAAGPFRDDGNQYPRWAPEHTDDEKGLKWLKQVVSGMKLS